MVACQVATQFWMTCTLPKQLIDGHDSRAVQPRVASLGDNNHQETRSSQNDKEQTFNCDGKSWSYHEDVDDDAGCGMR